MAQMLPALGIDVGGGSAKIGIVSPDGDILAQDVVISDPALTAADLLDHYLATANRLKGSAEVDRLSGIGIGIPGHIDFDIGTTRLCNVPSLNGFPIIGYVEKKSGLRVRIENDATLAAVAEHRFGSGQDSQRFMTVTLGTGIGVGFIENGTPVHTSGGTMGDIGHAIVDPTGARQCRQGCRGCLESIASALALRERFGSLLQHRRPDTGSDNLPDLSAFFEAAKAGDVECRVIMEEAALSLGAAVVSWTHTFAPDRIAFAGGVSAAGEDLLKPIRSAVARFAMPEYLSKVSLVPAVLTGTAGLVGAGALCFPPKQSKRIQA